MKNYLFLGIVFVLLMSGCNQKGNEENLLQTPTPAVQNDSTNLLAWDQPGASDTVVITGTNAKYFKVYNSSDLWFEFSVQVSDQEVVRPNVSLIRSGSVVSFVSSYSTWPYQHIETFRKSSDETVKEAIQRIILSKSGVDIGCFVTGAENIPNALIITRDTDMTCEWACFPTQFCWPYAMGTSVSFFRGDDTADKFYYIFWGQDTLPGLQGNPWFMEMNFFK